MKPYNVFADGVLIAECKADTDDEALGKGCDYAQRIHPDRIMVIAVFGRDSESGIVRRVFPQRLQPKPVKREAL